MTFVGIKSRYYKNVLQVQSIFFTRVSTLNTVDGTHFIYSRIHFFGKRHNRVIVSLQVIGVHRHNLIKRLSFSSVT